MPGPVRPGRARAGAGRGRTVEITTWTAVRLRARRWHERRETEQDRKTEQLSHDSSFRGRILRSSPYTVLRTAERRPCSLGSYRLSPAAPRSRTSRAFYPGRLLREENPECPI